MSVEIVQILGPGAPALAERLSTGTLPGLIFIGSEQAPEEVAPEPPAALLLTREDLRTDPRVQRLVSEHPVSRRPGMLTTHGLLGGRFDSKPPHEVYPVLNAAIEKSWIRHALAQFADLGGTDFVGDMVELFRTESSKYVAEMSTAIQRSDWQTAGRIAHTLKSSFANYGARRLQKLAQTMESEINAGNTVNVRQHYEALSFGVSRLRDLLQLVVAEGVEV